MSQEAQKTQGRAARRALVEQEFQERFGGAPELWVRAPGRVDLMGSHTDYNLGYVLTLSVDRDTWIAARPRADHKVSIQSINLEGGGAFDLDAVEHDRVSPWTDYVRGVAAVLQAEGYRLPGFDGLIHGDIPIGSGLSSSAALEVATALTFQFLGHLQIDPLRLALLCQRAENQFVGMNCGILDQYSSIFGQAGCALMLDCRSLTSEPVRLHEELSVVICDTRAKRELTGSEYPERRAQCEEGARRLAQFLGPPSQRDSRWSHDGGIAKAGYPGITALRDVTLDQLAAHESDLPPVVARRCRFIIQENARVLEMGRVLPAGKRREIRALTDASYAGARDLYEIGSPEMARMMEAMLGAPGVIGARQAGAGFGGCMVALVERDNTGAFSEHVRGHYAAGTGIEPQVYRVQAAAGAGVLQ
jgi:galactokinase